MPRNGSGTYNRVPGSAYTNGTVNDGSELDAEMNDIATALTASLTADGQKPLSANLEMAGFKLTGLGSGSAAGDSVSLGQAQAQAYTWLTSVSGTNTITATATPAISAYAAGQTFRFVPAGANTGAVTINISGVGAADLTKRGSTALVANDLIAGYVYQITYDGARFQIDRKIDLATNAQILAGASTDTAVTPAGLAIVLPAGAVMFFAMNTAPSGWLKANGALVSRTTYATLFAAIGTVFGAGDGSTTFALPNLCGEFVRGWDDGRGIDSGRTFGSAQDWQLSQHAHNVATSGSTAGGTGLPASSSGGFNGFNGYTDSTGGTENSLENRPRNIALLACIKY